MIRKWMRVFSLAAMVGVLGSSAAGAEDAKSTFESIFGGQLKSVRASAGKKDDLALATDLLAAIEKVPGQTDLIALLCDNAYALSCHETAGFELAVRAATLLAEAVPARQAECDEKILAVRRLQYARGPLASKHVTGAAFLELLLSAGDAKFRAGAADGAAALYREALPVAFALRRPSTTGEIRKKLQACAARQVLERKIRDLRARLAKNPDDAQAAHELVLIYVIQLDNPAAAKPYLATEADPTWQTYVPLAAGKLQDTLPAACVELGYWYQQLAAKQTKDKQVKLPLLVRAKNYLDRGVESGKLSGPRELRIKLALMQINKELDALGYTPPGQLPRNQWVDLMQFADLDSPYVLGTVTRQEGAIVLRDQDTRDRKLPAGFPIPLLIEGGYRLQLRIRWAQENLGAHLSLPVGPKAHTGLGLSDKYIGFSYLRGARGWYQESNPTYKRLASPLKPGRTYLVEVQVLQKDDTIALAVAINQKMLIRWTGSLSKDLRGTSPNDRWMFFSGNRHGPTYLAGAKFMLTDGMAMIRKPEQVLAWETAGAHPISTERDNRVYVQAHLPWTSLGLVEAKEYYRLDFSRATWQWGPGKASCGADGNTEGKYYLQGRIAGGKPFKIGSQMLLEAPASGLLQVGMSHQKGKEFQDNNGYLRGEVYWDKARRPRPLVARKTMKILASPAWTPIGLVTKGVSYRVGCDESITWRASKLGQYATPNGDREGKFYLQARVAGGEPFKVGTQKTFTAETSGVLEVGMSHQDEKISSVRGAPRVWAEPAVAAPATQPGTPPIAPPAIPPTPEPPAPPAPPAEPLPKAPL